MNFRFFASMVATLFFACPWMARAEPPAPAQFSATAEIYELPQAEAVAWQEKYDLAPGPDRRQMVRALRAGGSDVVKTVGFARRVCVADKPSTVETVEEYRYPTHFVAKDGFAVPSDFEITKLGCTMTLKVSASKSGPLLDVDADIHDVSLFDTQHYAASKIDQPGSIAQPDFSRHAVSTHFQLTANEPKLVGVYSPYHDEKAAPVLRLVFVTVGPER